MVEIREAQASDLPSLLDLVKSIDHFSSEEKSVAIELIHSALLEDINSKKDKKFSDYNILVALLLDKVVGYLCFGPTPMTESTYDLYWIATHPESRGKGVAKDLIDSLKSVLQNHHQETPENQDKKFMIRIETGGKELFGGTREFYKRIGMEEEGRIKDFYSRGDDLVIFTFHSKEHSKENSQEHSQEH